MYGQADDLREANGNLEKLDDMVTIAKKALDEILKYTGGGTIMTLKIESIALKALLKIERMG